MAKRIPRKMEFCVVSAGGVATTRLLAHFAGRRCVNSLGDEDSLKHLPVPPVSFNPGFRYVYLFGDPVPAVISLFRRGYQTPQARKLQRGRRGPRPELPETIGEYAAGGCDLFGFDRHFDNYYERHLIHPTLFVRYEAMWENLDAIRDFLGCETEEFLNFAPRCRRQSEEQPLCAVVREKLRTIYRPFTERLNALPDTFARGEHLAGQRSHLLFSKNMRLAAVNAMKAHLQPGDRLYGE